MRWTDLTLSLETRLVLGKDDKLTFRIGDSKTELKLGDDGRYTGTVKASVWKEYPSGILTLESDGDRITQILSTQILLFRDYSEQNDSVVGSEWLDCYATVDFDTSAAEVSKDGEKTKLGGDLSVYTFDAKGTADIHFTELKLVFDLDGKVFREVDLMNDKDVKVDANCYTYHMNDTVDKGEIDYYVTGKDNEGNTYKLYRTNSYILNSGEYTPETVYSDDMISSDPNGKYSSITDKDGNLVKKFNLYN